MRPRIPLALAISALAALAAGSPAASPPAGDPPPDPYLWLEEVDGERALGWVEAHNEATYARLMKEPLYQELYDQALAALDSESRIPSVTQRGDYLYNFWRDEKNPRGLYRRTTLEELRKAEPAWETVLDIDALSEAEGEKWVFKGMECLPKAYRRCLVRLSPGGGDAVVVREFDAETLAFVEGGFELPVAKTRIDWVDEDTLFVGTDFGPGSMTDSGYPRLVKLWKRGTPLTEAKTLHEGAEKSVSAFGHRFHSDEGDHLDMVFESLDFWTNEKWLLVGGELARLDLPHTAVIEDAWEGRLLVSLKEEWGRGGRVFPAGAVVVVDPGALAAVDAEPAGPDAPELPEPTGDPAASSGAAVEAPVTPPASAEAGVASGTRPTEPPSIEPVELLVEPSREAVVEGVAVAGDAILVEILDNVRGRLYRYRRANGGWDRRQIPFPDHGALRVTTVDDDSGAFFVQYESFTVPPTLYRVAGPDWKPEEIKAQEAAFDGDRFEVTQHFATSADGTRVPYFQVAPKGLELDGGNPTHIFSYGGFRNSLTPSYSGSYEQLSGAYGKLWLERGGVFVSANIRGGGEFGPAWHQAALLENRHKAFEDFEAVAEDLIARRVTSPEHLGIEGRSNGGLLVTAAFTRRPELFGAVVCGVPLTDMRRYHLLLAGASWMAEFGDPDDPEVWAYLETYSPYHRLEAEKDYPAVFFFTSTRDDRVHPGHARKFAARMEELGHEVWYYENTEGGHGGSSTNEQLAKRLALAYSHLWKHLGPSAEPGSPAG